jgi:hypothetical protein
VCRASPPRDSEQAVPLAGLLRVVLHGLGEVFVEGHGLPPGNDCPSACAAGFGSHVAGAGKLLRDTSVRPDGQFENVLR